MLDPAGGNGGGGGVTCGRCDGAPVFGGPASAAPAAPAAAESSASALTGRSSESRRRATHPSFSLLLRAEGGGRRGEERGTTSKEGLLGY